MFASLKKDRLAIITLKSLHSLPPELQAVEVTMQGYRKDFEELRDQVRDELMFRAVTHRNRSRHSLTPVFSCSMKPKMSLGRNLEP